MTANFNEEIKAFLARPRAVCPDISTATSDGNNSISLTVEFSKERILLLLQGGSRAGGYGGMVLSGSTITTVEGRSSVADLVRDVVSTLQSRLSLRMEIAHTTSNYDSWDQVDMRTPTMSFGVGGGAVGGVPLGGAAALPSSYHPALSELIKQHTPSKNTIVNLTQRRPLFIVRLDISDLQPTTLLAWGLVGHKHLTISVSIHPSEYLAVPPHIDVSVDGDDAEVMRSKSNIVRHLQHVVNHFARFISEGYVASGKNTIAGYAFKALDAKANARVSSWSDAQGNSHSKTLVESNDVLDVLLAYLRVRLPTITECCVVCDELHLASNFQPTVSTVCTRSLCMFMFQKLNVGVDTTASLSLHPAVLDMLLTFTRAAASSPRWERILTPFPTLFDQNGTAVAGTSNPNINLIRDILKQVKQNIDFSMNPCKYSMELQSWVIASNASYVQLLQKRISFIGGGNQFILVQSSQKHAEAFEKNRQGKKVVYAFHGSGSENWHSILRNGLVNASGTALQVNGAAYGSGIYISPDLGTSLSYMRALAVDPDATECAVSPSPSSAAKSSDVPAPLDVRAFLAVAVCEVIEENLNKSGSIWVQPREDYLMTRYILVFNNESVPTVSLSNEEYIKELDALTAAIQREAL